MSEWDEEFKCWNTDEPILPRKRWTRFCEMCGANKPVENHELWCPNEPDRLFKDDEEFWLGRNDDECCECDVCLDERPATEWSATNLRQEYVSGGWAGGIKPVFDPEGVGPEQATADGPCPPPARNPAFDALLEQMRDIHNRKNKDYAEEGNPYSNFEFAARTAGCSVDTVFRTLLGVKLARLDELLKGKTAQFESIADTRLDLAIYSALWASYGN